MLQLSVSPILQFNYHLTEIMPCVFVSNWAIWRKINCEIPVLVTWFRVCNFGSFLKFGFVYTCVFCMCLIMLKNGALQQWMLAIVGVVKSWILLLNIWFVLSFFFFAVIPSLLDAFINAECALLLAGLYRSVICSFHCHWPYHMMYLVVFFWAFISGDFFPFITVGYTSIICSL